MKKYSYILIAVFLLCQLSLPIGATDRLRSGVVATLAPEWKLLSTIGEFFSLRGSKVSSEMKKELEALRLENHNLRHQMELLKAQVDLEKVVSEQAELLKKNSSEGAFSRKRRDEIFRSLQLYMSATVGKVIFREAAAWSSSFWIDIGEKTNRVLGQRCIAKNSPVVLGTAVVGVIEYVGEHRSRVRLITDANLVPSVRSLRDQHYLAKGEMRGTRSIHGRSKLQVLKGVGFNYDFEDDEGASRSLTGAMTLITTGDLLVTTGMDGVFPAGLRVGRVMKVYPLSEGATTYEIDAVSFIENFDNLSYVTVLPPIES